MVMKVNAIVSFASGLASRARSKIAGAQSGNGAPQFGNAVPALAQAAELRAAMRQIISFIADNTRDLNFRVDGATGRVIITVIDPGTGEVIR